MSWIMFNGIRSTDLGVIVESMPDDTRAERRTTVVEPYGRDGTLTIDEGSYGEYDASVTINCFGKVHPRKIFRWLSGSGWLTTSDDPSKRRWVHFYGEQSASRYRTLRIYDSVSIPVSMHPYCHNIAETLLSVTSGMTIEGVGDANSEPILYVTGTGSGTIKINDNTIYISGMQSGYTLKIDAEAKFYCLFDSSENALNALTNGVIVELEPDDDNDTRWFSLACDAGNTITISGLTATIDPNWRWF